MEQVIAILFGWFLGLASPALSDLIKSHFRTKEVITAIKTEMQDLQFRLAVASLYLLQQYGKADKEFLQWLKPIVDNYDGDEPKKRMQDLLDKLLNADEAELALIAEFFRAKEGFGSSLKTYNTKFLDAHLGEISKFPISAQRKIHEFRTHIEILNQEVSKADSLHLLTFSSSVSEENHQIIKEDLMSRYLFVQKRHRYAAEKIGGILKELNA